MFILKKIVGSFLSPLSFGLFISMTGLLILTFTKRQKTGKIMIAAGLLFIILLSSSIGSYALLGPLENRYPPVDIKNLKEIKYIVVLGGGQDVSPGVPPLGQLGQSSRARLFKGIGLHKKLPGSKLVLSGGPGFEAVPVSETMARAAIMLGVKENNIITETEANDTYDEAKLLKPMLGETPFILVTSASHMLRSVAFFKKFGMSPIPAPANFMAKKPNWRKPKTYFPRSRYLRMSELALHEYLGLLWSKLMGNT